MTCAAVVSPTRSLEPISSAFSMFGIGLAMRARAEFLTSYSGTRLHIEQSRDGLRGTTGARCATSA